MSDPSHPPPWLLRRSDQVAVAALVVLALLAIGGWWAFHGGWRGDLVEIEQAEQPLTARFEVDINAADWPELMQLPNVGETLARRIVDFRMAAGPFRSVEDLRRVRGIGAKRLEAIRPYLRPISSTGKGNGR